MILGIIVRKVIILLQLTSVMPKRLAQLKEGETLFYYKETGTTPWPILSLEGARSDIEYEEPSTTPLLRHVANTECKLCVTTCCGPDCACAEPLKPTTSTVLPKPTLAPAKKPTSCNLTTGPSGRRDFSTRDYIKNVLTQDGDIGAVLNYLVRVTLQKVELMKAMDTRSKAIEYADVEDSEDDF